jgi:GNAT superfamily N-acetyltransferase
LLGTKHVADDLTMNDWTVQPFAKDHERAGFSCGSPALDDFIRTRVSQYEKRRLGKTFVAVPIASKQVIGFYTLAAGGVSFEHLPSDAARKLPKHPVPVVLLARLAVDQAAQGRGLGEGLLLDALQRTLDLSSSLGVHAVEVDALNDRAAAFYRKYGFTPLLDEALHLYLPISTIEEMLR